MRYCCSLMKAIYATLSFHLSCNLTHFYTLPFYCTFFFLLGLFLWVSPNIFFFISYQFHDNICLWHWHVSSVNTWKQHFFPAVAIFLVQIFFSVTFLPHSMIPFFFTYYCVMQLIKHLTHLTGTSREEEQQKKIMKKYQAIRIIMNEERESKK